jgi:hypothetical protein
MKRPASAGLFAVSGAKTWLRRICYSTVEVPCLVGIRRIIRPPELRRVSLGVLIPLKNRYVPKSTRRSTEHVQF